MAHGLPFVDRCLRETNTSRRGKNSKLKSKLKSKSFRTGVQFPIDRLLRIGNYSQRVGADGLIYLAAVLEYLRTEVLEIAGNAL